MSVNLLLWLKSEESEEHIFEYDNRASIGYCEDTVYLGWTILSQNTKFPMCFGLLVLRLK